jgi:hypothetical protein
LALTRQHPQEAGFALVPFVLANDLALEHVEPGVVDQAEVRVDVEAREVHRDAEPIEHSVRMLA